MEETVRIAESAEAVVNERKLVMEGGKIKKTKQEY
jgi:hypothetical protein